MNYTKEINGVIKYCAGKISTNKARVARDHYSHFKTHNTAVGLILTSKVDHLFSSFGISYRRKLP
jgi:hypothetical protein